MAVGWTGFLITLLPAIGLIQAGQQSHADRYMYLPMIGLSIAIIWGLTDRLERRGASQTPLTVGAVVACAAWTIVTSQTIGNWRDNITLFEHAIEVTDANYIAHHNLGVALRDAGRINQAVAEFREAVSIRPQSAKCGEPGKPDRR
jgi:tetratricopeptide (TPR) repeat protein